MTYVCEIRPHSHSAELNWSIEDIIARSAPPFAPFPIDVGAGIIGSNLLAMAIEAAIGDINASSALSHPRFWRRIGILAFFVSLGFEMSDLQIWDKRKTHP